MSEDESTTVGTSNDARLALLNQINDANDELKADDYQSVNDDGTTEAFVVQKADGTKEELSDEANHEEIIDHDAEKEVQTSQKEVQLHKLRINGVEREVTYAELVARAQKIEAADAYLAEAGRIRNEIANKAVQQPSQDVAVQQSNKLEEAKALARALQMGTEEEAAEVILKLRGEIYQAAPQPQGDISKVIDERLTFNEAITTYRNEYKDLEADPVLRQMVLDRDAEMIRNGDRRPYIERYRDIGNQVRGWIGKFKPADSVAQTQDKVARKAAAPAVPKAAGGKTPTTVDEEKEESTADIIAGIAAKRGGPQWMRGLDS